MISLQEYADQKVAVDFRQPLKTIEDAVKAIGWEFVDRPECCGQVIDIHSFLGGTTLAECKQCGKFVADVSAPEFADGALFLLDPAKVACEIEQRYIAGQREVADEILSEILP